MVFFVVGWVDTSGAAGGFQLDAPRVGAENKNLLSMGKNCSDSLARLTFSGGQHGGKPTTRCGELQGLHSDSE